MAGNYASFALSGRLARQKERAMSTQVLGPRLLFILTTVILVVFGLVMVYSASFVEAFTDPNIQDSTFFFRHQLQLVAIGLVALGIAAGVNYRIWNSWLSWLPWAAITVMLVLTLAFGNEELGGRRWFDVLGISFQPSEFAKIALLLVSAMLLVRLHESGKIKQITLLAALAIGLPILLILLQPDLGTAIIALAGIIAIAWFGELPMKPLAIAVLLVVFLGAAMIMLANFRMSRIDAWLDPWAYASDEGYQIVNSFYAFADGGVMGVGLGMSHQKYLYLPQPHNDLIFPIIGEEFGLIGTVSVVLLFMVFLYAAFRIARNAPDFYGRILAGSAATMIGVQAFLNMLCMVNLLPLTGKPLPFFSAGGSSIICTLILVGLILNVSFRSTEPDEAANRRRDQLLIIEGGRSKSNLRTDLARPGRFMPQLSRLMPQTSAGAASSSRYRKPGSAQRVSAQKSQLRRAPQRPAQPLPQRQMLRANPARIRASQASRVNSARPPVNPALAMSPARNRSRNPRPGVQRSTR